MQPNIKRFQESITQELDMTKSRVRDLIGNANWGEEGRYKEAILSKVISQFLPANLSIGTGFIVSNDDFVNGCNNLISKQLDIIIYDNRIPVIFKEGNFIIVNDSCVRAVIEVKAKVKNYSSHQDSNGLNQIIAKLDQLRDFSSFSNNIKTKFIGIFSYDYDENITQNRVEEALKASKGFVNHISLNKDKFIRFWKDTSDLLPGVDTNLPCYIRYNLENLSFSYFISNLIHIVSDEEPFQRSWFSFPIQGTKEIHRLEPIIYIYS